MSFRKYLPPSVIEKQSPALTLKKWSACQTFQFSNGQCGLPIRVKSNWLSPG